VVTATVLHAIGPDNVIFALICLPFTNMVEAGVSLPYSLKQIKAVRG
jgi:hypothetical protein